MEKIDILSSVFTFGSNSKGTIVLVMGRGAPGRVWHTYQVPYFIKSGFKVITFDNRGSGKFTNIKEPFTLDDIVEDTIKIIEEEKSKVFLLGTSLGSRIVQEVALKRPDLVNAIAIAAAHSRLSKWHIKYNQEYLKLKQNYYNENKEFFIIKTILDNFSTDFILNSKNTEDWYHLLYQTMENPSRGEYYQVLLDNNFDNRDLYSSIKVPTLCIAYEEDKIISPYLVEETASIIPNATLETLHKTGHFGYLEKPNNFNEIVISFFEKF